MEGATHFIEQWEAPSGTMVYDFIQDIIDLNKSIWTTKNFMGGKTIAIFLIKRKPTTNEQ